MKMTKKKVFVVALAICLITTISMGTLAWFSAEDKLDNSFIMNSELNFEIDVWEIIDDEGNVIGEGTTGVHGTTYENVEPGASFVKEVYVENKSGNTFADQYVKVEVTFTNYAALRAMSVDMSELVPGEALPDFNCVTMLDNGKFSTVPTDNALWWYDGQAKYVDNTATYTFYLKQILKDGQEICLFEGVTIPESMDINDAQYLMDTNGFNIKVVAYAIQAANIKKPGGTTVLDHAVYAFGNEWGDTARVPDSELYPTATTTPGLQ